MEFIQSFLNYKIGDFDVWRMAALFIAILVTYTIGKVATLMLGRLVSEFEAKQRVLIAITLKAISRSITFVAILLGLIIGIAFLNLPNEIVEAVRIATSILMVLAITLIAYRLTDVPAVWYERRAEKSDSQMERTLVPIVRTSLRLTVVVLALVQIAQILSDQPITSIIAGLGIGGLALALAAQDTIRNFFGSIVLISDKPFQVGERLVVDGHDGIVETVGMRSTKIRTLSGHLVSIPNGELANRTIENIGRRPFIRRIANITITYDTPPEKVQEALDILNDILRDHEGMKPDFPPRVYFSDFNSASLNLLVIYWYHPPDYWAFMDFSERVNQEIFRRFGEAGIDFAFPTQTLHLAGDQKRPLTIGIQDLKDLPER